VRGWIIGAALLGLVALSACAGFSEPVAVSVKNDLHQPVALEVCASADCSKTSDRWVLKPGQVGGTLVEMNSGYNSDVLIGSDHLVIGCLPFRLNKRPMNQQLRVVLVSQAVPCGSDGGATAAGNKDWPDPTL